MDFEIQGFRVDILEIDANPLASEGRCSSAILMREIWSRYGDLRIMRWEAFVGLIVQPLAIGSLAGLVRLWPKRRYWGLCAVVVIGVLAENAIEYVMLRGNVTPLTVKECITDAVFYVTVITATFRLERLDAFRTHPVAAVTLGPLLYLMSFVVTLTIGVNVGLVAP